MSAFIKYYLSTISIVFFTLNTTLAQDIGFLTLPFDHSGVSLQQGYEYNYVQSWRHQSIDYINGIAGSDPTTWQEFPVLASAQGEATSFWHDRLGYTVVIKHDELFYDEVKKKNLKYYTLYAHLKDDDKLFGCENDGSKVVCLSKNLIAVNTNMRADVFPENRWVEVKRGEVIGTASDTGKDSNEIKHLHYQVVLGELSKDSKTGKRRTVDPYGLELQRSHYPGCGENTKPFLWTECPPTGEIPQPPTPTFTKVSANGNSTCAVLTNGSAQCWGKNSKGQLGNGTFIDSNIPIGVKEIIDVVDISTSGSHTCAVLTNGSAQCWGQNTYGQLGNETNTNSNIPVTVLDLVGAKSISVGTNFSCALLSNGKIKCWGRNIQGQLGNGTFIDSNIPVSVIEIINATQINMGSFHGCSVLSNGTISCWGYGAYGSLGNRDSTGNINTPVPVLNISDALSVSAGQFDTCAVLTNGSAQCWGQNTYGQLGNETNTNSNIPVTVVDITDIVGISTGLRHTCASRTNGSTQCWGQNLSGQLGNGTNTNSNIPVTVVDITNVGMVSAGGFHSCATTDDGEIKCWGSNSFGEIGNNTNTGSTVPVLVVREK